MYCDIIVEDRKAFRATLLYSILSEIGGAPVLPGHLIAAFG